MPGLGRPPGVLPDMSRPPPGFMGAAVPPQGLPPPAQMGIVPHYDESTLIPSLPYFDLPAGLMVPLVKMEDSGYKPIDPKKIREDIQ